MGRCLSLHLKENQQSSRVSQPGMPAFLLVELRERAAWRRPDGGCAPLGNPGSGREGHGRKVRAGVSAASRGSP